MRHQHVVVQSPALPAKQLLLLFHTAGDNPVSMAEIGRWFAPVFPDALVVSLAGPLASGPAPGRAWFVPTGEPNEPDEQELQGKIDAVMPGVVDEVKYWQRESGVDAGATALIGFSQGATIALEAIKASPGLASRVISFSGCFASLPEHATTQATIHLIHGEYDDVVEVRTAQQGYVALLHAGGDVTLDIVDDLGHAIDERSMKFALDHLRYTIPRRYFDDALSVSPGKSDVIGLR